MNKLAWIAGALALSGCSTSGASLPAGTRVALTVTSPVLKEGAPIPAPYACTDYTHLGKSPALAWHAGPAGTVAYAITVTDPDAKGFVHWAAIGIPATHTLLGDGASPGGGLPGGATDLPNDFGALGYGGPCPPPGKAHNYVFKVWALKSPVTATKADAAFFQQLDAAALAVGTIVVTFAR